MTLERLRGMRSYLIGPIDRVADSGAGWRDMITPFLENLGVIVFDPLKKPIDIGLESDDNRALRKILKAEGRFDEMNKVMKPVRAVDMSMTQRADFLICHIDMNVHMCGTYRELFLANDLRQPIIIHCEQGKAELPDWLFGEMPHELFFSTWDEVKNYLLHINSAEKVQHFKRWKFFKLNDQTLKALRK